MDILKQHQQITINLSIADIAILDRVYNADVFSAEISWICEKIIKNYIEENFSFREISEIEDIPI